MPRQEKEPVQRVAQHVSWRLLMELESLIKRYKKNITLPDEKMFLFIFVCTIFGHKKPRSRPADHETGSTPLKIQVHILVNWEKTLDSKALRTFGMASCWSGRTVTRVPRGRGSALTFSSFLKG